MSQSVSVIIPAYNAGPFIKDCVEGALRQGAALLEVIVVDDGSVDGTGEILKSFGERITTIHQSNAGVSVARNNGARVARGSWLAFLDADDMWREGKLDAQVRVADQERVGFVHCGMEYVDSVGRSMRHELDGIRGSASENMLLFKGTHGNGSTPLVNCDLFKRVGGYDPSLSTSADWDLCYRVSRETLFGFVDQPLVLYRQHATNMHANPTLMRKDMLRAFEKAFKAPGPEIRRLRRRAYSALHLTLSGSFAAHGDRFSAVRHGLAAMVWRPGSITSVVRGSWRRLRRRISGRRE